VVLRDGASVGGAVPLRKPMNRRSFRLMAGREVSKIYPHIDSQPGEVVMQVKALTHPSEFADVSFELRRGEILGFYGLVGAAAARPCWP